MSYTKPMMKLEDEIAYFALQGYKPIEKREVAFYASYVYERGPITVEDYFYIVETCPSGAVDYWFYVNTEEEARNHKHLPSSSKFSIFQVRPNQISARRVANFYNSREIRTDGKGGLPVGWCYEYGPVGWWQEEKDE